MISLVTCLLSATATRAAAAYRPFLDPLPVDDIWLLLMLPLVLAIAIVYKTIKLEDLSHLPRQSAYLAAQIAVFMVLAAAALWLLGALV